MQRYGDLKKFCKENDVTMEQLDKMWQYMYDKNWKVKKFTDDGLTWTSMNFSILNSLIDLYNKELINNKKLNQ